MSSAEASSAPSLTSTIFHASRTSLDREIERDECRCEKYGGNDPEDPPPKTPCAGCSSSVPPVIHHDKEEYDPNLVTWDAPDDPENPQNWSRSYKWAVTAVVSFLTLNVTFSSSAPTSSLRFFAEEFHSSSEASYLTTTLFLLGYVFGPPIWGPGSEMFGRRAVNILTLFCYTVFHIGQGAAPGMATLLVTRFFAGFFASAPLNNCGGIIADVWDPIGRGPANSVLFTTIFLGPALGPLVGGFIVESSLGWRWVFWILMIFAGVCWVVALLFQPETYAPVILLAKARRLRKADPVANKDLYAESEKQDWSLRAVLHRTLFRPVVMLLKEPILVLVTIYLSVVYGIIYALFEALPVVFIHKRGLSISQCGLIFLGIGVGSVLAACVNLWLGRGFPALVRKWRGFPPAEERLYGAMVGGPLLVVGIFWLGWTGQYPGVRWYVPMLSTIPIGVSVNCIFMSFLSYLVDTYLMYAASAFAANTVIRSAVGAAFPLFTYQMFEGTLQVNWACTLLGGIAFLLAPMPFLFYKYGARIRAGSTFAPCIDLKIAAELDAELKAKEKLATMDV
ncbi:MFS polyamine transporter [Auriscalpium vulgare]|uniref:MFS polyamine transporter n=1 Tax=Auriscalpium vulgare TaxID=40419 RepID=A0ACB8S1P6_9AGAM|nr:MFS polyamine transporter [Auriscalpium vulgare]